MQISKNQVEKYRKLYFRRFGKEITNDEAVVQASALLALLKNTIQDKADAPKI